jgi:hypothetical protein
MIEGQPVLISVDIQGDDPGIPHMDGDDELFRRARLVVDAARACPAPL